MKARATIVVGELCSVCVQKNAPWLELRVRENHQQLHSQHQRWCIPNHPLRHSFV